MEDFGRLQACFTSPYEVVPAPCLAADFDRDDRVDQDDAAIFLKCLTGPTGHESGLRGY